MSLDDWDADEVSERMTGLIAIIITFNHTIPIIEMFGQYNNIY